MCGIAGLYHFADSEPVTLDALRKMNDCLVHRGPDDQGMFQDGPAGLAMRRLAIIDLSGGRQPMSSEDGALTIVFNGEIYNFLELKEELEKQGRRFRTRSDTEVILHLYALMGPDCVKRLRGMFAFALWDKPRGRLVLARDRLGKKPLVYASAGGRIAFASELRSLLTLPWVSRETDARALDMYLSLQYIPAPHTVFKSVVKLPPAHVLVCEGGKQTLKRYWDLPVGVESKLSLGEAKEAIRATLTDAVRLRMIADVPLGAFLSGGIDSSIVVALMSGLSERPVKTYSIGFEEEEFSELEYARLVAQRYATDHHEMIVKAEMAEVLPKLAWHYGEPYADTSALPSYFVARETRRHVTVALNGDGGDESFAGYMRYVAMQAARVWDALPAPLRAVIEKGVDLLPDRGAPFNKAWLIRRFVHSVSHADLPARHLKMIGYFSEGDKLPLYSPALRRAVDGGATGGAALGYLTQTFSRAQGLDPVNKLLFADYVTYLPECLLVKMDIASMANSLEARSPFLDHEFVELVFPMRGSWKLRGWQTKWLLKETFKDLLPGRILRRGKQGFGSPVGKWFRGRLKDYWREHVLGTKALSRGYFTEKGLLAMLDEHASGRRDHGYRMYALLMLELWHEQYLPEGRLET